MSRAPIIDTSIGYHYGRRSLRLGQDTREGLTDRFVQSVIGEIVMVHVCRLVRLIAVLTVAVIARPAMGAQQNCCVPCPPPVYKTVECTVMVPTMVTENRTIEVVECRPEQRTIQFTAYHVVPETKMYECEIMVPHFECRTEKVTCMVCKPVMTTQQQQITVMVPYTETRQATRQVCRMVPVNETQTVCEDQGGWQQVVQNYTIGCGDCARTCSRMSNVWVPKPVTRQVQHTVMRPKIEEVAYQYTVEACRPETRTQTVQVCALQQEAQTREVQRMVCVPQPQRVIRPITTCRMVGEQCTKTCMVPVPYTVQKQVCVQVCKMVPKQVSYQVPVPCDEQLPAPTQDAKPDKP